MSKIVITGVAGLLGSNLAKTLIEREHTVTGLDDFTGGYEDNIPHKVDFHSIDIKHFNAVSDIFSETKPDIVIHCACIPCEGLSVFSPKLVRESILVGTDSIASASIQHGVKRFLNMSSMARYGYREPPFFEDINEKEAPLKPIDPYGLAKLQAEQSLNLLSDIHGNFKVIHCVPHNIIGVGQRYTDPYRNVAAIFINKTLKNEPVIIYGDGQQKRSFSYVQDCVDAILMLATQDFDRNHDNIENKSVWNIGPDGNEIQIIELAKIIADICNKPLLYNQEPDRPQEIKLAWCSSQKAKSRLGYNPNTTTEQGIKLMVDWVKQRKPGDFVYKLPLEIINEKTPKTWIKHLI